MRRYKRQMNLSEVKNSFHQSGYVDWHLNPRLGDSQEDHEGEVVVQTAPPELKRPPLYVVVLMNDDYTPMEFVVEMLQTHFRHDLDNAVTIMLAIHHEGKGIAGVYPKDIAETKAQTVNRAARQAGYPLLTQIEPQA